MKATARIPLRVTPATKSHWQAQAEEAGMNLTEWMIDTIDRSQEDLKRAVSLLDDGARKFYEANK